MERNNENKRARAKERVKELKDFYTHLIVYLAVNCFITINKISRNLSNGETFSEAFFDLGTFFIWGAWGIGLAIHGAHTFGFKLFSKDWEERQIRKYMDQDRQEEAKYSKPAREERKRLS